jgi:anaerobic selenocysteine-containing dehydrogenase
MTFALPKLVEPPGECWSDHRILNELAKKLGYGRYFWGDEDGVIDELLAPRNMNFADLAGKRVLISDSKQASYQKHEQNGFSTPSGKVEIFSQRAAELGYHPLPIFDDLVPCEPANDEYPLIMTIYKSAQFVHSAHRNIPKLRKLVPDPVVELNPATASQLGLSEGSWVNIETRIGRIKQKLKLNSNLDPRVAFVAYGWWFPEKERSQLYGWDQSNISVLIDDGPPYDPAIGSFRCRGIPCKIYSD